MCAEQIPPQPPSPNADQQKSEVSSPFNRFKRGAAKIFIEVLRYPLIPIAYDIHGKPVYTNQDFGKPGEPISEEAIDDILRSSKEFPRFFIGGMLELGKSLKEDLIDEIRRMKKP